MTRLDPRSDALWFLPLGGTGEIGMNLNLYGHDGAWLMVDCGVTFADADDPGPHVQMPDPAFIEQHRDALVGLVITHAHEDHVGAVAHLWRRLRCDVYTTAFTAAVLRRKLAETGLLEAVRIIEVASDARLQLGPFDVQWLQITHSIPEAHGLVIRTPAGRIFHTGDWKLDPSPVLGPPPDAQQFEALAVEGIDAMVCDSTNALEPGHSRSEGALLRGLREVVEDARGRVIVTAFGSNLARLHTLARVAHGCGRHMTVLGRSLRNMVAAARATDHWHPDTPLIDARELGYLPRHEILAVATGSQGDPGAALDRLSRDRHPDLELEAGDTVVFSSRVIPGNEAAVARITRRLQDLGVQLITDDDAPIHASGHPAVDELTQMYRWVRPALAIPTHGEARHMRAHAAVARDAGVLRQLTGRNGDLFMIAPHFGIRRQQVVTGRLGLGEEGLEPVIRPAPADAD